MLNTITSSAESAPLTPQPFFKLLATCEDTTDKILSFLDPLNYSVERKRG